MRISRNLASCMIQSAFVFATLLMVGSACVSGDSLTNPPRNDGKGTIPWDLNLNYQAINIAVGDQVQIEVTPTDAEGKPIPLESLPQIEYTVADTAVSIDENGKITAHEPRASVMILAKMHDPVESWTIIDTVRVAVTETQYSFSGFKMVLVGDPVQLTNQTRNFHAVVTDAAGDPVLDQGGNPIRPLTYYTVSVPYREYYLTNSWTGVGNARNVGNPTIRGRSYIFGKVYEDSLKLTVTYPDSVILYIHRQSSLLDPSPSVMSQTDITIIKGGRVVFIQNNTTSPGDDIVFDDQANVIGGNIPVVARNPGSTVTFPNVGKFTYTSSTISGNIRGTITVVEPPIP